MELNLKLITKLPITSGTSTKGEWKKQDAIFETKEQYPKKVCITFFNDKVSELDKLKEGQECTVGINIESKEYNGKFYTSINAWQVKVVGSSAPSALQTSNEPEPINPSDGAIDSLPF